MSETVSIGTIVAARLDVLDRSSRSRARGLGNYPVTDLKDASRFFYFLFEPLEKAGIPDTKADMFKNYLVAWANYGMEKQSSLSMGQALGHLRLKQEASRSLCTRFDFLLSLHPINDSHIFWAKMMQFLSIFKSSDVSISWGRLLEDLLDWDCSFDTVSPGQRWAREYSVLTQTVENYAI